MTSLIIMVQLQYHVVLLYFLWLQAIVRANVFAGFGTRLLQWRAAMSVRPPKSPNVACNDNSWQVRTRGGRAALLGLHSVGSASTMAVCSAKAPTRDLQG
jgi:hypothetical protein